MQFFDRCDVYSPREDRDEQNRVIETMVLAARDAECTIAPVSQGFRQREYGQEREATHQAWFPISLPLTLKSEIRIRVARSDPSTQDQRFTVKTLQRPQGRVWWAVLVPAPTT